MINTFLKYIFYCLNYFLFSLLLLGFTLRASEIENSKNYLEHSSFRSTKYFLPKKFKNPRPKQIKLKIDHWTLLFFVRSFRPGEAVYIELQTTNKKKREEPILFAFNRNIKLTKKKFGYSGFFAIPPWVKPNKYILTIINKGKKHKVNFIVKRPIFPSSVPQMTVKKRSNRTKKTPQSTIDRILFEKKLKKNIYSILTHNKLNSVLSHPRNKHQVTSEFYKKRIYKKYKIEAGKRIPLKGHTSIHRGLDLWGKPGMPIYAMARGKVILVKNMYYEGNTVIIDHGNHIYSIYMHMSKIITKSQKLVEAGELIGKVGSTGAVTGPHLHVMIKINNELVHPLSFLALPIR